MSHAIGCRPLQPAPPLLHACPRLAARVAAANPPEQPGYAREAGCEVAHCCWRHVHLAGARRAGRAFGRCTQVERRRDAAGAYRRPGRPRRETRPSVPCPIAEPTAWWAPQLRLVATISELRAFLAHSAFPRTFVLDGAHRWWLRSCDGGSMGLHV
jgi:hypothetical protein